MEKPPPLPPQIRHPGEKFVQRHESGWRLARTQQTKFHLDPVDRSLAAAPVARDGRIEFDAEPLGSSPSGVCALICLRRKACLLCGLKFGSCSLEGVEIDFEQRLVLVALVCILLAQPDDLTQDLDVKAVALCFGVNFLFVVVQSLDVFLNPLDTLNKSPQLIAGDSTWSAHGTPLVNMGAKNLR